MQETMGLPTQYSKGVDTMSSKDKIALLIRDDWFNCALNRLLALCTVNTIWNNGS